jgi:hypothetical protein
MPRLSAADAPAPTLTRTNGPLPRVFLCNPAEVAAIRARAATNDPVLMPAIHQLESDATNALTLGPYSVTRKNAVPPSGDKHDYTSRAPYFWPNPATSNGLPYVRHDGERNPGAAVDGDNVRLGHMADAVETLALGYYFTRNEDYAARCAYVLRVWFMSPKTRMNPNFNFGQAVEGVNEGRAAGLIEARRFTQVVDAVGLLAGSREWTEADQRAMEKWFTEFLQWMRESKIGRAECAAKNNHGSFWDLQAVSYALFTRQEAFAREVLEEAKHKRIGTQIEPDGTQPLELARTKSWGYSVFNLAALTTLAELGDRVGVDLWHYETKDGRSLRKALDYLIPFAFDGVKWPHQQLGAWNPSNLYPIIGRMAEKSPGEKYSALAAKLPPFAPEDRVHLLRLATLPAPPPPAMKPTPPPAPAEKSTTGAR